MIKVDQTCMLCVALKPAQLHKLKCTYVQNLMGEPFHHVLSLGVCFS